VSLFYQEFMNGLASGAIYALIAVGYSLVYGILELINFAHGDVYMFTTYIVLAALLAGLPFPIAVAIGLLAGAVIAAVVERIAYRPLRKANRIAPTVSAVGVALVLENTAQVIWGPEARPFPSPLPTQPISVLGATISVLDIIILAVAAVLALALYLLVHRSRWGSYMRAIRDDLSTAQLMGIPVNRVIVTVYMLGAVFGAIAGILYASDYDVVTVAMGLNGTLYAFTAAVIGGIGSIRGAFAGGLILGLVQSVGVGFFGSGYLNTVTFTVLILFLVFRPAGIAGATSVRRA
jgi:branched-chain amino acid transport system permease protein